MLKSVDGYYLRRLLLLLGVLCLLTSVFGNSKDDYYKMYGPEVEEGEDSAPMDDYSMYELIERIGKQTSFKTLYELLDVPVDANSTVLSQAFRKRSLAWHPDRNLNDPGADAKYALLSSAIRILKHPSLRRRYDWIMNEAPMWHKSGYYVRRFMTAKLSIWQVIVLALFFISLVQGVSLLAIWSVAWLRRYMSRQRLAAMGASERKRLLRKTERISELTETQAAELEDWLTAHQDLPSLSLRNLYAIRLFLFMISMVRRLVFRSASSTSSSSAASKDH